MFDDAGNDVTPRPMLSLRPTAVGGKPGSTGMPGASASGVEMFSMGSASNVPSAAQIPPPSSSPHGGHPLMAAAIPSFAIYKCSGTTYGVAAMTSGIICSPAVVCATRAQLLASSLSL